MIERQENVEVPRAAKASPLAVVAKWAATLAAVATPLGYLNGRAFHDGYLGRLHLESSMFPVDVQGTFINTARAWMEGAATVLGAVSAAIGAHWFLIVVLPALLVIGLSAAIHYVMHRIAAKQNAMADRQRSTEHGRLIRSILSPLYALFLSAYGIYTMFAVIGAALLLSIGPFVQVGARAAAQDLEKGFPNGPAVELTAPHGGIATYRLIECADKFCALYLNGEIVTVPVASITWAVSRPGNPAPDH